MESDIVKKLSVEDLKKLKAQISESLANDRQSLLVKFPFTGNLTMHMDLIPVRDKRIRTACTDGSKVYVDMDFYTKLKVNERVFVLAHEIWHCVMMHLVRQQSRDPELFNIASDMEVNYLLSKQSSEVNGQHDLLPPDGLCFPPSKLEGKSAEVIYEWLLKEAKKSKKNGKGIQIPTSTNLSNGNSSGNDDNMSYDDVQPASSSKAKNVKKNGKDTGKLEGQFDKHKFEGDLDDNSNDTSGNVTDQWGEVGYDPDFQPKISSDFAEKMREAVIAEVQRCERTRGTVPVGIDNLLEKIMKPEISWKEVLAQFVTSCYNGKRRWLPPNRRHVYNDIYLQSRRNERIKVTVAIDTSGSCVSDLPKFFGELTGLLNSFGEYELNLIQCDAAVDKFDKYDSNNPFPVDSLKDIEWSGGGGTSFKPPFEYVRKNGIDQDCFVFFTDGYGDAPTYPPEYPVLWVLTSDGSNDFCDWGKKLRFKSSDYRENYNW